MPPVKVSYLYGLDAGLARYCLGDSIQHSRSVSLGRNSTRNLCFSTLKPFKRVYKEHARVRLSI
jgi:hypothetical protein